jgi:hypothetical protein
MYWIFIKGLSCTEDCLLAAARSHDLIAPAIGLTPALWSSPVTAACASNLLEIHIGMCGGELGRGQHHQELLHCQLSQGQIQLASSPMVEQ